MNQPPYEYFAARYNTLVQRGTAAWHAGNLAGLEQVELALGRVDEQYSEFTSRAALLGPEFCTATETQVTTQGQAA